MNTHPNWITDAELNEYRLNGNRVRVERDADPKNDVIGMVVAWNEETILLRKRNRKVVKLPRHYRIFPAETPRETI